MATIWPLDMEQQEKKSSGGYPTSIFLAPPPDDLKCTICMEVLRDPLQVCSDQHTYCRTCFASWRSHETCPECRAPFSREEPARIIKNLIDQLDVRCPNACEWTGHLNDCEAHMAACPFVEVSCPFSGAGCAFRAARRDMGAHSSDMSAHFLVLMTTVAAGKADCAAVKAENEAIKGEISSLRRYVSILHASGEEAAAGGLEWVSSRVVPEEEYEEDETFTYTGQMRGEKCHGFGRASWAAGRYQTYDGQWKEGKKSGHALMNYRSGDTYEGDFGEDGRHGRGVSRYSTGERYEGQWKEDKIHGQGVYTNNIGDGYNGEWKENKFHGQGVYTWSSGISYEGAWRDSKRHGQGVHRFRNGDSEVGRWVKDRQQGCFILTKADGTRYDRTYESDRRVSETPIPHTTPNPERGTMTVRFA
mmetsp:Transcript_6153/g.14143  ORF Transcript_6153/g.14143 Transcript_6153/m.14143 type:complete len:417 (-) Transcript_6153:241-1491(-)